MPPEIPLGIPEEVIASEGYQDWKKEALGKLEPPHPVNSRQRFATQRTHYVTPDMAPGVVRFRTEDEAPLELGLIAEAEIVDGSSEYLLLGGQISALESRRTIIREGRKDSDGNIVRDGLYKQAEAGWRGTEFEDLGGTGRAVSAIPQRGAKVVDRDLLMMTTGEDFPRVAESVITLSVHVPEGHRVRGRVIQPEDIIKIIKSVLEKTHLSGEFTNGTYITDLDVLRELIERDMVSPEAVKIERDFTLRPDVLSSERTPKPKKLSK